MSAFLSLKNSSRNVLKNRIISSTIKQKTPIVSSAIRLNLNGNDTCNGGCGCGNGFSLSNNRYFSAKPSFSKLNTSNSRGLKTCSVLRASESEDGSNQEIEQLLIESLESERKFGIKDAEEIDSAEQVEARKNFFATSGFKLEDIAGRDQVALVKTTPKEIIRVMFNASEVQAEEEEGLSEEFDEGNGEEEIPNTKASVRTNIVIEKPGRGALSIDADTDGREFSVNYVQFFQDSNAASALTPEAELARRVAVLGPPFSTLDESLQQRFEAYLESLGIDDTLADFIAEYVVIKENNEYVGWLSKIQSFVKA